MTDPGVRGSGIVDQVTEVLKRETIEFEIYDQVTADSGSRLIREAVDRLNRPLATSSSALAAEAHWTPRAVAALATNPARRSTTSACTKSGTGRPDGGGSDDRRDRQRGDALVGLHRRRAEAESRNRRRADLSGRGAVRSDLTTGLPPALTASTGMDALAHAIECYTNKACQPISAALALKVALISRHLRRRSRTSDCEARARCCSRARWPVWP